MINFEYLDTLYTWKVEAEQKLEKLQGHYKDPMNAKNAEWLTKIRDMEIAHAKEVVNRYKTAIKLYISNHN
jgi:CHASE3 domain sensor protein